jgi:hypothetical protein
VVEVGDFSGRTPDGTLPPQWESLRFQDIDRETRYGLTEVDGRVAVQAVSDSSASGLIRRISVDPGEYPILQWHWRVSNVLKGGDVRRKSGDDYPARVYVLFEVEPERLGFFEKLKFEAAKLFYGEYPPQAGINYIWASNAPEGTVIENPYTERTIMFVVESGRERLDRWVSEERNVYQDFLEGFGRKPPMVSGVAIMTDTDNTGESATASYGDIRFLKSAP